MSKKVFELAKELGIGAIDLVEKLRSEGLNVRNHMVALTDDELNQALKIFEPKEDSAAKKKVTKKKVTKKKVVKKAITGSASSTDKEKAVEAGKAEVTKKKAKRKNVITVKRKSKATIQEEADEALEMKNAIAEKKTEDVQSASANPQVEKTYEDDVKNLHTFTPVYVPEKEDKPKTDVKAKPAKKKVESDDDDDDDNLSPEDALLAEKAKLNAKKKVGNLAGLVEKKGVKSGKDITMFRADEELKIATTIAGTATYTPAKRKKIYSGPSASTIITEVKDSKRVLFLHNGTTAEDLAQKLSIKFNKFIDKCLSLNLLVKADDYIGIKLATEIASLFNYRIEDKAFDESTTFTAEVIEDKSHLPVRNPIITIMGHVDHGKTTLLDYIRSEKVAEGEAGGITQHIGAYSVKKDGATLTFLDTPGHAAFGAMRQRGADVTDIVVLVVAADDGVMPQTKESIKYAQKANCPLIIAINKMDKDGAKPDRIKQELMEFGISPEEWGGDTQMVPISALKGDGIDSLLEAIKLQAEIMDLRETDKGGAEGIVIESKIETGRGPVATILIQKGTLKKGDSIVVGECYGRARSLMNYKGEMVQEAGPSTPVQILGLDGVAIPGDTLNVVVNEREAKKVVDNRITERKSLENAEANKVRSIDDFFSDVVSSEESKTLPLIIRTDVQGSFEAIKSALEGIGNDEVKVNIIGGGIGAITDSDVDQAASSNGYIIGFNMRPVTSARKLSEVKGIEIKTYSVIYALIDDIKLALEGMLTPDRVEKYIGRAEVRETFSIPKFGTIAGSSVIDGKIERGCSIRLLREGKILHDGSLSSLKRFKDDVKEVKNGYECGIALENYNEIKVGDLFEAYIMEEKKRTLESNENIL